MRHTINDFFYGNSMKNYVGGLNMVSSRTPFSFAGSDFDSVVGRRMAADGCYSNADGQDLIFLSADGCIMNATGGGNTLTISPNRTINVSSLDTSAIQMYNENFRLKVGLNIIYGSSNIQLPKSSIVKGRKINTPKGKYFEIIVPLALSGGQPNPMTGQVVTNTVYGVIILMPNMVLLDRN